MAAARGCVKPPRGAILAGGAICRGGVGRSFSSLSRLQRELLAALDRESPLEGRAVHERAALWREVQHCCFSRATADTVFTRSSNSELSCKDGPPSACTLQPLTCVGGFGRQRLSSSPRKGQRVDVPSPVNGRSDGVARDPFTVALVARCGRGAEGLQVGTVLRERVDERFAQHDRSAPTVKPWRCLGSAAPEPAEAGCSR